MKRLHKILLIDDDNVSNHINKLILRQLDITEQIVVSTDGYEALESLQQLPCCPELIFLDINMPAMDGFEFLEALKELSLPNQQEMVIIVLTTSQNVLDINRISQLGDYDYINKPLNTQKLILLLRKYFPEVASSLSS